MKNIFIHFALAVLLLTGCSSNQEISRNIVKGGECYEIDNVSFYYPNQFTKTIEDRSRVRFEYNNVIYEYTRKEVKDDNQEAELVVLFRLDLESLGNVIKVNTKSTLDNGDTCYEIVCEKDEIKSKYILVFEDGEQITLMYQASVEDYDDTIDHYLYSLVVLEAEEIEMIESYSNND